MKDQGVQQLKQGPSKFDAAMGQQGQVAQAAQAHAVQGAQAIEGTHQVDKSARVEKTDKADMERVNENQASAENGSTHAEGKGAAERTLSDIVQNLERGQSFMDTLVKSGMSGKKFSNAELLALQAGVYQYSQELELTGKVVEKATSGLKDTLKMQV